MAARASTIKLKRMGESGSPCRTPCVFLK
jgi:hypothetical protein